MSKKIFKFSGEIIKSKQVEYQEKQGKAVLEMTFFSTAYNRNKVYFQVPYLMKVKGKEGKLLFSFNHDLTLTSNKYLGNKTKLVELNDRIINGEYEVFGKIETTDSEVLSRLELITAPSIEVSATQWIEDENGVYLIDPEWEGITFLLGEPQGSGDARLDKITEYSDKANMEKENLKQEKEVKNFSEEDKKEVEKTDTTSETVEESKPSQEETKVDFSQEFKTITEKVEKLEVLLTQFLEKKETEKEINKEPRDEIEKKFDEAESNIKNKTKLSKFEKVEEVDQPTSNSTSSKKISQREQVYNNLSNILQ